MDATINTLTTITAITLIITTIIIIIIIIIIIKSWLAGPARTGAEGLGITR
jgi:hypothetical protein